MKAPPRPGDDPTAARFSRAVLDIDPPAVAARIQTWLRTAIARDLHKRGAVVAVSGGVDSAVCAALARRSLGAERVHTLFLPGQNSTPGSAVRARWISAGSTTALAHSSAM